MTDSTRIHGVRESKIATLINGATADTASLVQDLSGYNRIALTLYATAISSGNGTFTVYTSPDKTIWNQYNMLIDNVTHSSAVGFARIGAKNFTSNGTATVYLSPETPVKFAKVILDMATDGTYTAIMIADTV